MTELKSNSNKSRAAAAEKKDIKPVVTGSIKKKKKTEIQKFADVFIAEDIDSVKDFIFKDVLVPALKKAISDVVTNGIDILLYGETGRSRKSTPGARFSYDKIPWSDRRRDYAATRIPGYDYGDIILDSRADAEELLESMDAIVEQYEIVSVADLYDLMGATHAYTDNNYGWTSLTGAAPVRLRDGSYTLKLPKAMPLT